MDFININNLNAIMAEMTDFCNAACPMCNRYDWDLRLEPGVTNTNHTTLDFVKTRIGTKVISQLNSWSCQGTYGDASMNPEAIEIFQYLREQSPNIKIGVGTNGGARHPDFWATLGEMGVNVCFAIDGLEDTNHLYRRNVKWDKLMKNIKAYVSAGGRPSWEFLIFKHNQHQVDAARQLSKDLGFKDFSYAFSERWSDYNPSGEYRNITSLQVDDYVIEKPTTQESDYVRDVAGVKMDKKGIKDDQDDFLTREVSCWACRKNKREIYLRANGYVSPCCTLGDVEKHEPKNIIKDFKKINLNYTDLAEILDGEYFKTLHRGILGGKERLKSCYNYCGV